MKNLEEVVVVIGVTVGGIFLVSLTLLLSVLPWALLVAITVLILRWMGVLS